MWHQQGGFSVEDNLVSSSVPNDDELAISLEGNTDIGDRTNRGTVDGGNGPAVEILVAFSDVVGQDLGYNYRRGAKILGHLLLHQSEQPRRGLGGPLISESLQVAPGDAGKHQPAEHDIGGRPVVDRG